MQYQSLKNATCLPEDIASLILSISLDSIPVIPITFPIVVNSDNNLGLLKSNKEIGISIYPLLDLTKFNKFKS